MSLVGGNSVSFIFLIIAFASLIFSAANPDGVSTMRTALSDTMAPAFSAVSEPLQSAAMFVRDVSGISELQATNLRLAQENERLRDWYQSALQLEAENKSLRELLHVKVEPENRYITARVLADASNTFVKSMILAAGKNDGVAKGQAVVSGEGVVGRIVEAGRRSSRVLLVTDINSRVPVLVEDSRQHAILAGQNDSSPMLMHLPPDTEIRDGARIVTSGQGGIFPPGLPVGRVARDKTGAYRIMLFADFDRMIHVRVVNRPDDPNLKPGDLD